MKSPAHLSAQIVIIGAGAGGSSTALSLAQSGHQVLLLDAHDQVGVPKEKEGKNQPKNLSTSWINPGRAGHGFHYMDLTTGQMLMESTINVYRKYPGLQVGAHYPESHPIRRGRYFITKDSLFPKEQVLEVYSQLQAHYRLLVEKDPKNQVLGHPDDFFRILKPREYKGVVNVEKVSVGVETTEQLINPALLAKAIFQAIKKERNITVLTGKNVTKVSYAKEKFCRLTIQDGGSIEADELINCTWENMEVLDQTLGLFNPSVQCTNRLKALAMVELPKELRNEHSMFFCMGPFCMFSNCDNGIGLLTFAPITNVANYEADQIDERGRRLLKGEATPEEIRYYGEGIIQGVAGWIPAMSKARLLTVRFGIVKTYGDVDIFDPRSKVHIRNYYGVEAKQIGYIGNACMKLMNLEGNAKLVVDLVAQSMQAQKKINTLSQDIIQKFSVRRPSLLKLCLSHYLRRQFLPADLSSSKKRKSIKRIFIAQMKNKKTLHDLLSSFPKDASSIVLLYTTICQKLPPIIAKIVYEYCEEHQPAPSAILSSLSPQGIPDFEPIPQGLEKSLTGFDSKVPKPNGCSGGMFSSRKYRVRIKKDRVPTLSPVSAQNPPTTEPIPQMLGRSFTGSDSKVPKPNGCSGGMFPSRKYRVCIKKDRVPPLSPVSAQNPPTIESIPQMLGGSFTGFGSKVPKPNGRSGGMFPSRKYCVRIKKYRVRTKKDYVPTPSPVSANVSNRM